MHCLFRQTLLVAALALAAAVPTVAAKERWTKVESPFFTIYSEASEKRTRDWAVEFEQFRRTMSDLLHTPPSSLEPVLVVIFRNEGAMAPFKPVKDGRRLDVNGFTANSPLMTCISLSFEGEQETIRHSIFFGGTHWFLSGLEEPAPLWLRTGLAEVFSSYEVEDKAVVVGLSLRSHVIQLAQNGTMSMARLFGIGQGDLPYKQDNLTRTYHAQTWAFSHYLLFGRGTGGSARLGDFLNLLQLTSPDRAFERAFDATPERMEEKLNSYIRSGTYSYARLKFDRAAVEKAFKLLPATDTEVQVAKGYVLLLNNDRDGARACFERARFAAPNDPKPYEALADFAWLGGDQDEALRLYERAAECGSANFRPYYQLADRLLHDVIASDRFRLQPAAARRAARYLERAINLNPYYVRSYARLALACADMDQPTSEDPKFLERGLQFLPQDALLEAAQAALLLKDGKTDETRARLAKLSAPGRPMTARTRAYVQRLQGQIEWSDGVVRVEQLLADRQGEEAEALIDRLLRADILAEQRVRLNDRRTYAGELQTLAAIENKITAAEWADAEILARPLLESASVPAVQEQARALLDKIKPHLRR